MSLRCCSLVCRVLLFFLLCNDYLYAGEPVAPTPIEQQNFAAKLSRLQNHAARLPHPVTDAIASLSGTVTDTIDCPNGSAVDKVIIRITTTHIKWDRSLAINGTPVPGLGANAVGFYHWNPLSEISSGQKTVTCTNYIMLDPNITNPHETDSTPFGLMADEALLYHELLHGQLLIDSIKNNTGWQNNLCNCLFGVSAQDSSHNIIHTLEESFLQNLFGVSTIIHIVTPEAQQAKDELGNFEIIIADTALLGSKNEFFYVPYFPTGSNIDSATLKVEIDSTKGKIVARGKLIDNTRLGLLMVYIDPPSVYIFTGIETAMVVLPFSSTGQTFPVWILIVLGLGLIAVCLIYLLRKKKIL